MHVRYADWHGLIDSGGHCLVDLTKGILIGLHFQFSFAYDLQRSIRQFYRPLQTGFRVLQCSRSTSAIECDAASFEFPAPTLDETAAPGMALGGRAATGWSPSTPTLDELQNDFHRSLLPELQLISRRASGTSL